VPLFPCAAKPTPDATDRQDRGGFARAVPHLFARPAAAYACSMARCRSCGRDNLELSRYCANCGEPLSTGEEVRERKLVTVLFCDLVDFTARFDQSDPEDVRAALALYHARVRREIERFGGTVEKFIGDAVVGVFGAPIAH